MTSVYLTGEKGILCLYRVGSRVVNNLYIGSAGGHFEPWELNDAKACVLREMAEELGITEAEVEDFRLRYVALRLKNGEIRQNYYFFGRLKAERTLTSTEGVLHWIPYDQIPSLQMPASAKHMMEHYLHTGRYDDRLYAGIVSEEGTTFVPLQEFDD